MTFSRRLVLFLVFRYSTETYWEPRVLGSRPKGRGFEPHRRHSVVFLGENINPNLVLV